MAHKTFDTHEFELMLWYDARVAYVKDGVAGLEQDWLLSIRLDNPKMAEIDIKALDEFIEQYTVGDRTADEVVSHYQEKRKEHEGQGLVYTMRDLLPIHSFFEMSANHWKADYPIMHNTEKVYVPKTGVEAAVLLKQSIMQYLEQ